MNKLGNKKGANKSSKKEKLLDERKKQIFNKLKTEESKRTIKVSKKPLKKIGFLIITLAIIGLIVTNFSPWYYISMGFKSTSSDDIWQYEEFFYSNTDNNDFSQNLINRGGLLSPEISYYNGIFKSYFDSTPSEINIGFIVLLLLGIAVVLFEWFDKKKDFSFEFFTTMQGIIYSFMLLPTIFLSMSVLKFISSYILEAHNFGSKFQNIAINFELKIYSLISPASIIIMVIILFLIIIIFTVMETDLRIIFKEVEKKKEESNKPKKEKIGVKI